MPPDGETLPLVLAAFQLVDVIAGEGGWGVGKSPASGKGSGSGLNQSLRPETRVKLRKVREDLEKTMKEELVKEKKEEQAEEKAAAKKKAEEERLSRLSAAEQKKVRLSIVSCSSHFLTYVLFFIYRLSNARGSVPCARPRKPKFDNCLPHKLGSTYPHLLRIRFNLTLITLILLCSRLDALGYE